ncbi:hypothetical protein SLEP1_g11908 [Rubroshorea leprosula]|nr:hypothetical protein SLEP1_g11908 [Rubroshorea leprosula]
MNMKYKEKCGSQKSSRELFCSDHQTRLRPCILVFGFHFGALFNAVFRAKSVIHISSVLQNKENLYYLDYY